MNTADDKAAEAMLDQLEAMLAQMQVPELCKDVRGANAHRNLAWLSRNLHINNPKSIHIRNALEAVHWLLRNKYHR